MSTEELRVLLDCARRYSAKLYLLIAICAFRGLRVSEALAINILDFSNDTFTELTYREAKTNKLQNNRPLIKPLAEMIRVYVHQNNHLLRDGYLFPAHVHKYPFIQTDTAIEMFKKLRRITAKEHPRFMDVYCIQTENGKIINRHRIGLHSLRRWFETHLKDSTDDVYTVKEIMDYERYDVLNSYLNRNQVMQNEANILDEAFTKTFKSVIPDLQHGIRE